ncbi:YbfB/YjiJ family MFS transporter [Bradyrhizobium yuanmingense]
MAGLSASLVGLGLARFSYTPLTPDLIAAKWFTVAVRWCWRWQSISAAS